MSIPNAAERLFAQLCNQKFLRGFVFHSPRYDDPTEKEAGDVVLWVRTIVIDFEIISRSKEGGPSTKSFVKSIGKKRDQLVKDYEAFQRPDIDIVLINEHGKKLTFDKKDILSVHFYGVVIVDCDEAMENLHYGTIEKTLHLPFTTAIMTKRDFLDLSAEIDTIPDLKYYLMDRFDFLYQVYPTNPRPFLNLNRRLEKQLIAFYKMHENNFPVNEWDSTGNTDYWAEYTISYRDRIEARDIENRETFIIDDIIDHLRRQSPPDNSTMLHSWELATLSRRARTSIPGSKIYDAIRRMLNGNPERWFAFDNQATGCWTVFYFQYGGDRDGFREKTETLTKFKLFVEMQQRNFKYSVFGYGFRKSALHTDGWFDDVCLVIEDASDYSSIPEDEYQMALNYFGYLGKLQRIREFPY